MNRRTFIIKAGAGIPFVVVASSLFGAQAAPDDKQKQTKQAEEDARVANVLKNFEALKSALSGFNTNFKGALVATVQYERLGMARDKHLRANPKATTWSCDAALSAAKEKCKSAKGTLGSIAESIQTKLGSAKGASKNVPASRLPWGANPKALTDTVELARGLWNDVNSAKTAAGEASISRLWIKVQKYAESIPDYLPQVKAEELVPKTVTVPCTLESVSMR